MKPVKKRALLVVVASLYFVIGCSGAPTKLGPGTFDKSADIRSFDLDRGRTITAEASGFQLLLVIPIGINDRQQRAFQLLRAEAGADYISDIKVKESWTYALIGTVYKTTMTATAYPRKN